MFLSDQKRMNLKANWFLPISACSWILLGNTLTALSLVGAVIAFLVITFFSLNQEPFKVELKHCTRTILIVSVLNSLGCCVALYRTFLLRAEASIHNGGVMLEVTNILGISENRLEQVLSPIVLLLSAFSFFSLMITTAFFWSYFLKKGYLRCLRQVWKKNKKYIYFFVLLVACLFVFVLFSIGDSFELAEVFGSDGFLLYFPSAYGLVGHSQNDIRQPLFGFFSMPFYGISYLLGSVFQLINGKMSWMAPAILVSTQLLLLFIGIIMFADSICSYSESHVLFFLAFVSSSAFLFSFFIIEQYMIEFFYLSLLVHEIAKSGDNSPFLICSAGGCLIPSVILTPFLCEHKILGETKLFTRDLLRYALVFLFLLCAVGQFGEVISAFVDVKFLLETFGKRQSSILTRFSQYSNFILSCFFRPSNLEIGISSITLSGDNGINLWGLLIFCLAILSSIVNRKQRVCNVAILWVVLSFAICCLIGWGSAENNMPLYSLYFSWAFLILLFALVERIHNPFVRDTIYLIWVSSLVIINLHVPTDLLHFAMQYIPK